MVFLQSEVLLLQGPVSVHKSEVLAQNLGVFPYHTVVLLTEPRAGLGQAAGLASQGQNLRLAAAGYEQQVRPFQGALLEAPGTIGQVRGATYKEGHHQHQGAHN